ncbi:hypothetical protein O4H66_17165 [Comamonadaceae bacterium G21597-S1]|nr:hypothetical protein [Comamonadaceae bacterium G21597-S1]
MSAAVAAILAVIGVGLLACGAGVVLFLALLVKHTPPDRSENRPQDDADIGAIRDSMRGTL